MNERSLKTLYLVDMDRCLVNTDAIMQHLERFLIDNGASPESANHVALSRVDSNGVKDVWKTVEDTILPDIGMTSSMAEAAFFDSFKLDNVLNPGAAELLTALEGQVVVVTFGNESWQRLKARIAGLSKIPLVVVDTPKKGSFVKNHNDDRGLYSFVATEVAYHSENIVLVDDNPLAFEDLPLDCKGYHVVGIGQATDLAYPSNITKVSNLYEVAAAEGIQIK